MTEQQQNKGKTKQEIVNGEGVSWHDKNARIIERGDIIKVYHFTGARRKRYYMYKQCLGISNVGASKMMTFGHLNFTDEYYHLSPSENWLVNQRNNPND